MPSSVSIVGSGGVVVSGNAGPIGVGAGTPPELHGDQWGLFTFSLKVRKEERA